MEQDIERERKAAPEAIHQNETPSTDPNSVPDIVIPDETRPLSGNTDHTESPDVDQIMPELNDDSAAKITLLKTSDQNGESKCVDFSAHDFNPEEPRVKEDTKSKPRELGCVQRLFRQRETLVLLVGLAGFFIGCVFLAVGAFLMQSKCPPEVAGDSVQGNGSSSQYGVGDIRFPVVPAPNVDLALIPNPEGSSNSTGTTNSSNEMRLVNLAEGKMAYQSSTMPIDGLERQASLATDGQLDFKLNKGSCAQTDWEEKPFWYVDLIDLHLVKRVQLVIPNDCCIGEMHNFEVRIGQQTDLWLNSLCRYHMGTALKVTINMECDRPIYGRYVSIEMLGDETRTSNRLTLCEVLVYRG